MASAPASRQEWSGKRVLVTGAGGFIGSHLCDRLVSLGATVTGMVHYRSERSIGWLEDRPCYSVIKGDVQDLGYLLEAMDGQEVVFHLAAVISIPQSYKAPASFLSTNTFGTLNILSAAAVLGTPMVIITSSSEVYGSAVCRPQTEDHPLHAQSPYAASKIAADQFAEALWLSRGLPVIIVRPFNTYGPRQSQRAVIPSVITQALLNGKIQIARNSYRDFLFVEDTVEGFLAAASYGKLGEVYNLGTGRAVSLEHLADTVKTVLGRPQVEVVYDADRDRPENSEVGFLEASYAKAYRELGWEPRIWLTHGIDLTSEWFKANLERYSGTFTV